MLAIFIPTLHRPEKLQAVADNIKANTRLPYELYWIVESFDPESLEAAIKTGHPVFINLGEPGYSDAIQTAYELTDEPIFFPANDDFKFLPDWDVEPQKMLAADEEIGVLGVSDGNPKTSFGSIYFVRRKYVEEQSAVVDMPNRVLYPYKHNFSDNEITETAKSRGVWAACSAPCIEHQHPSYTWLGEFETDPTYEKNNQTLSADAQVFNERVKLWQ